MPPVDHPCHPASRARDRTTNSKLKKGIFALSARAISWADSPLSRIMGTAFLVNGFPVLINRRCLGFTGLLQMLQIGTRVCG